MFLRRILARLIDFAIITLIAYIMLTIVLGLITIFTDLDIENQLEKVSECATLEIPADKCQDILIDYPVITKIPFVIILAVYLLYYTWFSQLKLNQQNTFGRRFTKLRLISLSPGDLSFAQIFTREILFILYFAFGLLPVRLVVLDTFQTILSFVLIADVIKMGFAKEGIALHDSWGQTKIVSLS